MDQHATPLHPALHHGTIGPWARLLLFALSPALALQAAAQQPNAAKVHWSTYLGGTGNDQVLSMAVDSFGHVYVAGRVSDGVLLANDSSGRSGLIHQATYGGGNSDAFVAKYAPQGSMLRCSYFGGTGDDEAVQLVLAGMDGLYLVGNTNSTSGIATDSLALQGAPGGGGDVFLARFTDYGLLPTAATCCMWPPSTAIGRGTSRPPGAAVVKHGAPVALPVRTCRMHGGAYFAARCACVPLPP